MTPHTATGKKTLRTLSSAAEAVVSSPDAKPLRPAVWKGTFSLIGDHRLVLWNLFLIVASPLLFALKLRKYVRKRHNYEFNLKRWFLRERELPPPGRPHLIFVGATFGEVRLAEPLIEQLRAEHQDLFISIATRDQHTIDEWRARRPNDRVILLPFDFVLPAAKFLRRERPDYVVFMEMYSFPNLVAGAKRTGARIAVANGRAKDFYGPSRYESGYYRWILSHFDLIAVQTPVYRDRIKRLSREFRPEVTGNLKLDIELSSTPQESRNGASEWLSKAQDLPILAAGSSNTDEEDDLVLDAFQSVHRQIPCRLLFAPRNLARVPKVLHAASARGLTTSRRSHTEAPADLMVLDTIGELREAYGFSTAAYVGGSLNGMGHNVLEPAQHGIPVSYGPRRGHFEEIQKACEEAGVGFRVSTSEELATHWKKALSDASFLEDVRRRAPAVLSGRTDSLPKTLDAIERMML